MFSKLLIVASLAASAYAECPNACSGHGECSTYDMCTCYRNWQGADCSERTCPFDLAHVDTPKGDLDHSGDSLSIATKIKKSTVYPYGTTEKFPAMVDSGNGAISESAHYYMECSNKGICDRKTGECECFDGYEGTACQRASCPNDCNGHGTCHTIQYLANDADANVYELWDAKSTMGCKCDPPFYGPDCSARQCKYGTDPLYDDNDVDIRYNKVNVDIQSSAASALSGTYAIKFYDVFGEDYVTAPISLTHTDTAAASCSAVVDALKGLPNKVISDVSCTGANHDTNKGVNHVISFYGNPGPLRQIEIDQYLDGEVTPSLSVSSGTSTVNIYQSGYSGEYTDYFSKKCNLAVTGYVWSSTANTDMENKVGAENVGYLKPANNGDATKDLKKCLGDADGLTSNNVDVEDWDYGYFSTTYTTFAGQYVHAVKLQDTTTAANGAHYALVWSDGNTFVTINKVENSGNTYQVYTTDGVAQQRPHRQGLLRLQRRAHPCLLRPVHQRRLHQLRRVLRELCRLRRSLPQPR
jgi:hypothetical protein